MLGFSSCCIIFILREECRVLKLLELMYPATKTISGFLPFYYIQINRFILSQVEQVNEAICPASLPENESLLTPAGIMHL